MRHIEGEPFFFGPQSKYDLVLPSAVIFSAPRVVAACAHAKVNTESARPFTFFVLLLFSLPPLDPFPLQKRLPAAEDSL